MGGNFDFLLEGISEIKVRNSEKSLMVLFSDDIREKEVIQRISFCMSWQTAGERVRCWVYNS